MEGWFAKGAKATLKYSRNAFERVTESASDGAKWGSGETKENPGDGNVLGGLVGGALGAVYGIGRAAVGVPKDITRNRSKKRFQHGITVWGPRERLRCAAPLAISEQNQCTIRVVCVRHGHARHNDLGGVGSMGNRDAELTKLGIEEAKQCSELLRDIQFEMAVVSPYRRCLETAALLLGPRGRDIPHEIQPLAGEHNGGSFENDDLNLIRSTVARGDLGSEKETLMSWFPLAEYPQYQRGFSMLNPQWWEHNTPNGYETNESFVLRATALRQWLGSLAPTLWARQASPGRIPVVLLVSHGGILTQTFECGRHSRGKFQNCEFRVFDVCQGGAFAAPLLPASYVEPSPLPPDLSESPGSLSAASPNPAPPSPVPINIPSSLTPVVAPPVSPTVALAADPIPPSLAPPTPIAVASPVPAVPSMAPVYDPFLVSSMEQATVTASSSSSSAPFADPLTPPTSASFPCATSPPPVLAIPAANPALATPSFASSFLPVSPPPENCLSPGQLSVSTNTPVSPSSFTALHTPSSLPLLYRFHSPLAASSLSEERKFPER